MGGCGACKVGEEDVVVVVCFCRVFDRAGGVVVVVLPWVTFGVRFSVCFWFLLRVMFPTGCMLFSWWGVSCWIC